MRTVLYCPSPEYENCAVGARGGVVEFPLAMSQKPQESAPEAAVS